MIGRFSDLHAYREVFRSREVLTWLGGTLLIPVGYLLHVLPLPDTVRSPLGTVLFLLALAINGLPIILGALRGLLAREINVDELVSIALIACLVSGHYAEGAMVSAIMVLGSLVEEAVSNKARKAIRSLVDLTPETALLETEEGECSVPIQDIRPGDILILRAGDTVPVDGTLVAGDADIDESSITGESIPVAKSTGAQAFAGTRCLDGFMRIRAERVGPDSTMGRIIRMVEAAEQQKTRSGKIVDRYAAWFTPAILICAGLTLLLTHDLTRGITVLIVGCPCSFLLASPVSTVAAISRAARSGILIRGGQHLENLAEASGFFFDKTGTLTQGRPEVVEIEVAEGFTETQLLRLAAAVERGSLHPLGLAIVARASALGIEIPLGREIRNEIGRGISGRVGSRQVEVLTSEHAGDRPLTQVDVRVDGLHAGRLAFFDGPRAQAAQTMQELRLEGIRDLVILSGDRHPVVQRMAEEIGLTQFHGGQKPEGKLARLRAYTRGMTVYVGDGINDAPALKEASTGIAMGLRGVDVALETADVVLMNDRIDQLPFLVRLGRRMARTIRRGILLSLAINLAAIIASACGILTPVLGAITHNIGSILVVSLAASLRYGRDPGSGPLAANLQAADPA
nr:cation-translocating P-type ATPase [uncultured Holophaga sp.]